MCTCFIRFKFYISYRSLSAVVAMTSYLKETAYNHGHCKWCMAKESTKLPISEQFDNDVQMVPKTKTDVVDHVCCLLCFILGPGLIVQCHSQNKLKRSCKNVITGASKSCTLQLQDITKLRLLLSAHPHDDSQA